MHANLISKVMMDCNFKMHGGGTETNGPEANYGTTYLTNGHWQLSYGNKIHHWLGTNTDVNIDISDIQLVSNFNKRTSG